jgi:hypothetical protein
VEVGWIRHQPATYWIGTAEDRGETSGLCILSARISPQWQLHQEIRHLFTGHPHRQDDGVHPQRAEGHHHSRSKPILEVFGRVEEIRQFGHHRQEQSCSGAEGAAGGFAELVGEHALGHIVSAFKQVDERQHADHSQVPG